MTTEYTILTHKKFDKEFEKLKSECDSLDEDFFRLKNTILFDLERGNHRLTYDRYKQISGLGPKVKFPVFKVKKFRCKSIPKGNRSGFRFIFILSRKHKVIYFTEVYHKKHNKNRLEDTNRIRRVCSDIEYYFELK